MDDLKMSRHLICLSPLAEDDLNLIARKMEVNYSLAVRQALHFFAQHIVELEEKYPNLTKAQDEKPK